MNALDFYPLANNNFILHWDVVEISCIRLPHVSDRVSLGFVYRFYPDRGVKLTTRNNNQCLLISDLWTRELSCWDAKLFFYRFSSVTETVSSPAWFVHIADCLSNVEHHIVVFSSFLLHSLDRRFQPHFLKYFGKSGLANVICIFLYAIPLSSVVSIFGLTTINSNIKFLAFLFARYAHFIF